MRRKFTEFDHQFADKKNVAWRLTTQVTKIIIQPAFVCMRCLPFCLVLLGVRMCIERRDPSTTSPCASAPCVLLYTNSRVRGLEFYVHRFFAFLLLFRRSQFAFLARIVKTLLPEVRCAFQEYIKRRFFSWEEFDGNVTDTRLIRKRGKIKYSSQRLIKRNKIIIIIKCKCCSGCCCLWYFQSLICLIKLPSKEKEKKGKKKEHKA